MIFEWDEGKRRKNLEKHGVDFDRAYDFDWDGALIFPDHRLDYQEKREWALGLIEDRLYVVVFTLRGEACRIISMRKANDRERERYDRDKT
jgi:uncharacterized DUF497 family protein